MDKKKITKIVIIAIVCVVAIVLLTILINDCFFQHEEPLVYVTNTGECYHSFGCSYLRSVNAIGLEQAKKAGYRMCSRCGGKASGTIEVNNYFASFLIVMAIIFAVGLAGIIIKTRFAEKPTVADHSKTSTQTMSNLNHANYNRNEVITTRENVSVARKVSLGDQVYHAKFGIGKIINIDGKYMSIDFNGSIHEFVNPNSFDDGYLTLIH